MEFKQISLKVIYTHGTLKRLFSQNIYVSKPNLEEVVAPTKGERPKKKVTNKRVLFQHCSIRKPLRSQQFTSLNLFN